MSTLAVVLRIVALLAFAGLMLLAVSWCRGQAKTRARQDRGDRAPLVAHLAAFGLFFLSLLIFSSSPAGFTALLLALSGALLALAGADLGLARPRGGETAQPYIWRALRGLSTPNQDDHPAPSLDPAHDVSTNRYAMRQRIIANLGPLPS